MRNENGRLSRKVALITGAGSGIGAAMAGLFASEGAQVAAIALHDDSLEKWQGKPGVLPIRADITRLEEIDRMFDAAERHYGQVDIVCNVAGIHDLLYPLHETSDELWDKVVDLNLKAPFQICRRAIHGMMARGSGVILNVSSLVAYRGLHGPSYCAAKAGLIGMTLSIAVKYSSQGIRCNAINPGPVNTSITSKSGGRLHEEGWKMLEAIETALPVRWLCEPEDIAPAALFLCSDDARHINGAVLAADGGMSVC